MITFAVSDFPSENEDRPNFAALSHTARQVALYALLKSVRSFSTIRNNPPCDFKKIQGGLSAVSSFYLRSTFVCERRYGEDKTKLNRSQSEAARH